MPITSPADVDLKEKDIENFLKTHLHEVVQEDHLLLISQERPMQEDPDLIAVNKDGCLYIFELKRWESRPENLLQVMRYGQIFGRYSYEKLEDLSKRRVHHDKLLQKIHQEHFNLDEPLPKSKFNDDQVFVLITNGLDSDTISAVQYWKNKGVQIECAPYRIYNIGTEPYIQFDSYSSEHEVITERNTNVFIVNTCGSYRPDAWKTMLRDGKASAYYDRKYSVTGIGKGDYVYLYHTGIGIIAKGKATSNYKSTDCDGDRDEEFYIPLDFSAGWKLPDEEEWEAKAPKASQINQQQKSGHRFRQTAFSISENMAKSIDDIYLKNNKVSH